jgi:hypothetical protein
MPDPSAPENLPPGYELGDFNDPYNAYLSTIPVMELTRDYQIGDAMAKAGFTGNRYSTDAQAMAGLMDLLYSQSNQDLDRALQAAQSGGQLGIGIDALQRGRLGELSQFGTYEQDRIDDIARMLFADYRLEEYGFLPELIAASSSNVGIPYTDVVDQGKPGAQQWITDILPIIAAIAGVASDERLKDNIRRHEEEVLPGVPLATWTWKDTGTPAIGVIAQDLERVAPELVVERDGYKTVPYGLLGE